MNTTQQALQCPILQTQKARATPNPWAAPCCLFISDDWRRTPFHSRYNMTSLPGSNLHGQIYRAFDDKNMRRRSNISIFRGILRLFAIFLLDFRSIHYIEMQKYECFLITYNKNRRDKIV